MDHVVLGHACKLNLPKKAVNTRAMAISMETVRMLESLPGRNQSELSDLPLLCHVI